MRLLSGAAHALGDLAEKGVILDKLYATSNSPDGIKDCLDLGFEEINPDPETTRKRFMLDVTASNSLILREYHQTQRQRQ
jgi:hypothetical protein